MTGNQTDVTTQTFDPSENDLASITVSESAKSHILSVLEQSPEMNGFRLYLATSGCSGFMYETELTDSPQAQDRVFEFGNLKIFVPEKDLAVLNGTEIDFIKIGLNSMFQFRNPNVTGECGCGESFSVTEEDESNA